MSPEDLLVATVAVVLGAVLLTVALARWEWFFQLPKARWLEERTGRPVVRLVYAALGALLIALGAFVATR